MSLYEIKREYHKIRGEDIIPLYEQGHYEAFNDIFVALRDDRNVQLIDLTEIESYQETVESLTEIGINKEEIKKCSSDWMYPKKVDREMFSAIHFSRHKYERKAL